MHKICTSIILFVCFFELIQVKALLTEGALVNFQDGDGRSAALESLCAGHHKILQYLLQQGYDINQADNQGRTVLHEAIISAQAKCLDTLLHHKYVIMLI